MKSNVGELEKEIREEFFRRSRKKMTGVVQDVLGKRRCLVRFQDELEKEMLLIHTTIVVIRSELEEDIEVREVEIIPEVSEDLGCYRWVYISLNFIKEDGLDKREEQVGVEPDTDG